MVDIRYLPGHGVLPDPLDLPKRVQLALAEARDGAGDVRVFLLRIPPIAITRSAASRSLWAGCRVGAKRRHPLTRASAIQGGIDSRRTCKRSMQEATLDAAGGVAASRGRECCATT